MAQIEISYLLDPNIQTFLKPADGSPDLLVVKYKIPRVAGEFNETLFKNYENPATHTLIKSLLGDRGLGLAYYGDHPFVQSQPMPDELARFTPQLSEKEKTAIEEFYIQPVSDRYAPKNPGKITKEVKTQLKKHAKFFNDGSSEFKAFNNEDPYTKIGFDNGSKTTTKINNLTAEWLLHKLDISKTNGKRLRTNILRNALNNEYFQGWDTSPAIHDAMGISGYTFTVIDDFRNMPNFLVSVEYLYLYAIYRQPFTEDSGIQISVSYALVAEPKSNQEPTPDTLFLIGLFNSPYGYLRYYDAILDKIRPSSFNYPRGTALTLMRIINANLNSRGDYMYMGMDAMKYTRKALMHRKPNDNNPRIQLYRYRYYYQDYSWGKWHRWPLSKRQYDMKEDGELDEDEIKALPDIKSVDPIGASAQPKYSSLQIANELEDPHFILMSDLNEYKRITYVEASVCNRCGKTARYLCGNCLVATYCSARCQRKDWTRKHKKQCQ